MADYVLKKNIPAQVWAQKQLLFVCEVWHAA